MTNKDRQHMRTAEEQTEQIRRRQAVFETRRRKRRRHTAGVFSLVIVATGAIVISRLPGVGPQTVLPGTTPSVANPPSTEQLIETTPLVPDETTAPSASSEEPSVLPTDESEGAVDPDGSGIGGAGSEQMMLAMVQVGSRAYAVLANEAYINTMAVWDAGDVQQGELLGRVGYQIRDEWDQVPEVVEAVEGDLPVISTILPVGTPVYTVEGYDPSLRVMATVEGQTLLFEASFAEAGQLWPDGTRLNTVLDLTGQITSVVIIDEYSVLLGRIEEPAVLRELEQQLASDETQFRAVSEEMQAEGYSLRLSLQLADGSSTTLLLDLKNDTGYLTGGDLAVPARLTALVSDQLLLPLGYENPDYGSVYAQVDYLDEAAMQGMGDAGSYEMANVWVDTRTNELKMGNSLSDGPGNVLATDAAGDVRIEGRIIYYRSVNGEARSLTFNYTDSGNGGIHQAIAGGEDLTPYVGERLVLGEGPFERVQFRQHSIWTLDSAGQLAQDGRPVAEGVTDYVLDRGGVTFADGRGIYRTDYSWSDPVLLRETAVSALAMGGGEIYAAVPDSGIWRMQVDGSGWTRVSEQTAVELSYDQDIRTLVLLDADGQVYLLPSDYVLSPLPVDGTAVGIDTAFGMVLVTGTDGLLTMYGQDGEPIL